MSDSRIEKLADVLVHYAMEVEPEQVVYLVSSPLAQPLIAALYRRIVEIGALPVVNVQMPGLDEIMFTHGSGK